MRTGEPVDDADIAAWVRRVNAAVLWRTNHENRPEGSEPNYHQLVWQPWAGEDPAFVRAFLRAARGIRRWAHPAPLPEALHS
jgi:hypothetical protein